MTLEERMTAMEEAYGTQSDLMRELRDAVTVTAQLEARQGKILTAHGEWLASHDEAMKSLDERIANLVSRMGAFMRGKDSA